ncbi:MAG: UDP-glucuronic acid decarboxylase family protein [Patescibacteria group bacterium]|nr:UDP-glucuronic acid decarboxylase family protein [Patescibacteria group bacterium]
MMAKILVTGGAGFIGSHLCKKLLEQEHEVLCLDNFFTGQKQNITELMDSKKFELIRHDVTQPILLEVDQIYHLACPASTIHYQYNPVKTIKTNVVGTLNMLGLAKRVKARILFSSTSEIYGSPLEHPQKESYWGNVNPIGTRACYDEGKRCAETLCFDYHRQNDTDIRVIRIFNTYGPNMLPNDNRVVSNFVVQALQNHEITIYGDGNQTRSFQYISDLIDGMLKMMNGDYIGPVNLGNPHEITIKELTDTVLKLIPDSKSKIIYKDLPKDDPHRRKPDISFAKKKLKWEPTVGLEDGIKKTIDYFKGVLDETRK